MSTANTLHPPAASGPGTADSGTENAGAPLSAFAPHRAAVGGTAYRFDSSPPTAPASPVARAPRSGVFAHDATTLTAPALESAKLGAWIPVGVPKPMQSLRCALRRLNGTASWSCYRTSTGRQIAVANIGPLRVTAEAETSELAINKLRDLVLGLERGRKELVG